MIKHRYVVKGVRIEDGLNFQGTCVAYDIISAINLFRDNGYSVHTVPERMQVRKDMEVKIEDVFILSLK